MNTGGYDLKEMVQELRSETKEQSTVLTRVCVSLENIDKHLSQLNSKVATHELLHAEQNKRFSSLETFQTKTMMVYSIGVFVIGTVATKILSNINL